MENKPDYRPDLIPQGTFKRNLVVFFVTALCFASFAVIFWWNIKTPPKRDISPSVTASNPIRRETINLPVASAPPVRQNAPTNTSAATKPEELLFRCTDNAGNVTYYKGQCPPNTNSQEIPRVLSAGFTGGNRSQAQSNNRPTAASRGPQFMVIESPKSFTTVQQCKDRYDPLIRQLEELARQRSTQRNREALFQLKNDRWACIRAVENR